MRSPAEINDAARETFVHRNIRFAGERIFWVKARAVTANSFFIAKRGCKCLSQCNAAIFDRVMRVHFQVAFALELQAHRRMFGKQREHVVEKRDSGFDLRLSVAVEVEGDGNSGFLGVARDFCLPGFHRGN